MTKANITKKEIARLEKEKAACLMSLAMGGASVAEQVRMREHIKDAEKKIKKLKGEK